MFAVEVSFNRPFSGHSTASFPALVCTCTCRPVFLFRIDATVAPHDPVPDAYVLPTPRSQKRSEEHTSELQSHHDLVCRLLLEKKNHTYSGLSDIERQVVTCSALVLAREGSRTLYSGHQLGATTERSSSRRSCTPRST